jgi:nitroreductase
MTTLLNKILSRIQNRSLSVRIAVYDWMRVYRYVVHPGLRDQEKMLALITCHYHILEKGLSMKEVRPLFGRDVVSRLLTLLDRYKQQGHDRNACAYRTALEVLAAYEEYHVKLQGIDPDAEPLSSVCKWLKDKKQSKVKTEEDISGGRKCLARSEIMSSACGSFPELMASRYSVRSFGDQPVSEVDILKVVQWAQKSPSVCNRQEIRVIAVRDADKIQKILELQGGTRGFAEQVDKLLIVGGDLRAFHSPVERNQVYCDSGIFAMSLLLGLHHLGLGGCSLHWCVEPARDRKLRDLVEIPNAFSIAMLIAVGSLPEEFNVACSQRIETEKVLVWR